MSKGIILFTQIWIGATIGLLYPVSVYVTGGLATLCICVCLWTASKTARAFAVLLFVLSASHLVLERHKRHYQHLVETLPSQPAVFDAVVQDVVPGRQGGLRLVLDSRGYHQRGVWTMKSTRLILSAKGAAAQIPFRNGDRILVRSKLRTLQPACMPGLFDDHLFGLARGIHGRMGVSSPQSVVIIEREYSKRTFSFWRQELRSRLTQLVTPREAGIILALVIGDTAYFDQEQLEIYRRVGAGHLLAVSGLQVTLIAVLLQRFLSGLGVLLLGARWFLVRRWAVSLVTCCVIWGYVGLCAWPPSCIRAALMASICIFILTCNHLVRVRDVFGFAGCLTLLIDPLTALDPSFLLSYAAISGLLLSSQTEQDQGTQNTKWGMRHKTRRYLFALCSSALGAGLMTVPLTAYLFGEIAPGGIVSNIVLVPAAAFLQIPAIGCALVGALLMSSRWAQLGAGFGSLLEALCEGFGDYVGGLMAVQPPGFYGLVFFLVIFGLGFTFFARKRFPSACVVMVTGLLVYGGYVSEPKGVAISVIPIGQGDSALFELPNGTTVLIDGGGTWHHQWDPGERILLPFLARRGITKIDLMIVSHPDPDHLLGLLPVMREMPVGRLWHSGFGKAHPLMKRLLTLAKERSIPVQSGHDIIGPHWFGQTLIQVLAPDPGGGEEIYSELGTNDNSLVIHLSYGENRALWTGDIEEWGENYLLQQHRDALRADLIKVPHHGSRTSSQQALVTAVAPEHVVFTTGRNNQFGFPHREVTARYQATGARLWDTAEHGLLQFWLTGSKIVIGEH